MRRGAVVVAVVALLALPFLSRSASARDGLPCPSVLGEGDERIEIYDTEGCLRVGVHVVATTVFAASAAAVATAFVTRRLRTTITASAAAGCAATLMTLFVGIVTSPSMAPGVLLLLTWVPAGVAAVAVCAVTMPRGRQT